MGAGGIIQQRAAVLVTAVMESCFYSALTPADKDAVEQIAAKEPMHRTEYDLRFLSKTIQQACC